jgi:hypothetical protein
MAEVYYWLGDASETTATIVVRSDTAGTLTVSGVTATGIALDPAVEYGVGKLAVTGLAADTQYPFTLLLDGGEVASGILRTMPASGSWKFGFGSCIGKLKTQLYGYQYVNAHDIRAFFALGDTPYCDATHDANPLSYTRWKTGGAVPSIYTSWDSGRASWDKQYDFLQRMPGWEYLTQNVPLYRLPDDHEYGNDWDWSTDRVSLFGAPAATITTQAQVDTCGGYANAAAATWNKGNPANADPEIGDWAPSSCADAASNHPPRYFRKTIGNVEFFFIDSYAHMDPVGKADAYRTVCIDNAEWNAELGYSYSALAKTRLGPYQLNWLLTHLASSSATFKVIMSGKVTYRCLSVSDNEGWSNYATERDYILAWIKHHVTGVLWCAGDVHTANVVNDLSGHCCVNSSPLGQIIWLDGTGTVSYPQGYTEGMTWRAIGPTNLKTYGQNPNAYGLCEVTDSYLKPAVYAENGTPLWSAYLKAGKNYLQPTIEEPGEWA